MGVYEDYTSFKVGSKYQKMKIWATSILLLCCSVNILVSALECGVNYDARSAEQSSGQTTTLTENPWIAGITKTKILQNGKPYQELHCTGSIINDTWIVTAAHCFKDGVDREKIKVVVGAQNLENLNAEERQDIEIKYVELHPKYIKDEQSE